MASAGRWIIVASLALLLVVGPVVAQESAAARQAAREAQRQAAELQKGLQWPPQLPDGVEVVTDCSPKFLEKPAHANIREGVVIATTPPTIDFAYYGGQMGLGKPWSVWGDGVVANGKFYATIGDHFSPRGTAQVYEYDPATRKLRMLVDLREFLEKGGHLPEGMNYTPGKVHGALTMARDGWLYYATHRGSARTTTDEYGYQGDWVFRTNPATGVTEIVVAHPVAKHCIPAAMMDGQRMIVYGGTKEGANAEQKGVWFFAYDAANGKLLKTAADGFGRYAMLSSSTGRFYWAPNAARVAGNSGDDDDDGPAGLGRKYDPATNEITDCPAVPHVRASTSETADGLIYGVSNNNAELWVFNVKTETLTQLGQGAVASQQYVTSMEVDPTGRYVYYIPGAHGGGVRDGTPIVQFDTRTRTRKIIAFVNEFYTEKYGYAPDGTFGIGLSEDGATLYVTWNGRRVPAAKSWDTCAMMAIHIPESERQP